MTHSKKVRIEESATKHTATAGSIEFDAWQCTNCDKISLVEYFARKCCSNDFPCQSDGCQSRISEQYRVRCQPCREALSDTVWSERKRKEWDGEAMIYSDTLDRYFTDPDDAFDYLEDSEDSMESLRLIVCEPLSKPHFEVSEFLEDYLPDSFDAPLCGSKEINKQVNSYMEELGNMSWEPGNYALDITDYDELTAVCNGEVLKQGSGYEVTGDIVDFSKKLKSTDLVTSKEEMDSLLFGGTRRLFKHQEDAKKMHESANYLIQSGLQYRGTVTGRINCMQPTLSNIPRPKEQLKKCSCEMQVVMNLGCQCGGE
jgi:hypothetical protein